MKYLLLISLLSFSDTSNAQTKDTVAYIRVQRYSCSGRDSIYFVVYKTAGVVSAYFNSNGFSGYKELMITTMTKTQIDSYRKFFRQLKRLKQHGGCTTYYLYAGFYKNKNLERFDGDCQWFGIEKLLQSLSGDKNYWVLSLNSFR